MSNDQYPADLTAAYAEMSREFGAQLTGDEVLTAVTGIAVRSVPGADQAGITTYRSGRLETLAPTDPVVEQVDAIQYELRAGPCVDAVLEKTIFRTGDLRNDQRWPEFGRRAADEVGINSMLAVRLYLEELNFPAGLNLYAKAEDAFAESAEILVTVLATHAALAVAGATARGRASHLEKALASNREIGVAMGVLMNQHKITREQAFGLLRLASQNANRKLADIASEVADTGALGPATRHVPGAESSTGAESPR